MLAIKVEPEDYPNWEERNSGRIFPEGHGAISGYTGDSAVSITESISSSLVEGCENEVKREEVGNASSQESGNCVMEATELASSCLKGELLKRIKTAERNDVLFEESEDGDVVNMQVTVKVEKDDIAVVIKMEDSDSGDEGCGESSILQQNSHQLEASGSYEIYLAGMSSDNTNLCVAPSDVVEGEDSCAQLKNSQRLKVPANERQNSSVCEEEIQGEYELPANDMESPSHSSENPDSKNNVLEQACTYEKSFKCKFCNKSFSPDVQCSLDQMILNERGPREILKVMHKYGKCISVSYVERCLKQKCHGEVHRVVRPFPCRFCEKSFVRNAKLRMHEINHTGEKPFKCKFCEKSYRKKYYRDRHERIHTGERPFKCRFCKRLFTQNHHRKQHEMIHTDEKPFRCSYCDKSFVRKPQCRHHEMTHTGERPFKCQFCEKSYTQRRFCKQHEMIHTGEKSFRCSYCEKSFVSRSTCRSHERTHTGERPFKCQFCEKSFTQRHHCKQHEMIHTGENSFRCSYCEKSFVRKSTYRSHERTHTEERPFKC